MSEIYSLIFVFILILLNGAFVAAEFSIARLRKTQVEDICANPHLHSSSKLRRAKRLVNILANINDYISACQVGITISSLALGAIAEAEFYKILAPIIENFNPNLDSHTISIIFAIAIITFFHVILGEVVPKNIAILKTQESSFALVYFLEFLHVLFHFPVKILNSCSGLCLKMLGIENRVDDQVHSEDEIKLILSSSQEQGILEKEEEQLIQNVFDFNDTIARDIMVPRTEMICLDSEISIEEASKQMVNSAFSRFPIYKERLDNIIGYISIKDILKAYENNHGSENITTRASQILKVSDGMYVIDLIKLMQEKKKPIALLIDEYGGTSGLVTIEDIVEEIFGEIDDENALTNQPIQRLANGDILVDGLLTLKEVNEELETNFQSSRYDTLGGFVFGLVGTEPKIGDLVEYTGKKLRIEKHLNNRVKTVRILADK